MRSDFLDSKNQKYYARPNRILGLTEHHYGEELEGEEWKRLHQNTMECLKVFWDSELFGQLKDTPPENVLEIEDLTHFLIGDLKVWVSLDYCRSHQDLVHIYDWKTGRSEKEATAEQLACYALYAKETWGVEVEKVQLVEFNLAKNKVIDYPIREVDLIEVQSEILDSALSMQSLLFDKPGNMAREEDFSPTDDEETCRRCSFRGVCSDSLS